MRDCEILDEEFGVRSLQCVRIREIPVVDD